MKYFRGVSVCLAVLAFGLILSNVSFAQDKKEAKIKLLQDSAAALQQSNPALAGKLADLAKEEVNESKEKIAGKKETSAKGSPEWKAKHEERVKLFKDAAAALAQSHPDLAKSLEEMATGKHKMEMQAMPGQKNEKEEAGEKVEPKSEKAETK